MKKLISVALLAIGLSSHAAVLTVSTNIAATAFTIMPMLVSAPATVDYIVLTPAAGNAASCKIYDTSVASDIWTNSAYKTITTYATNYYTLWTNYYGATNYSGTNVVLMQITNTVAASTNLAKPIVFSLASATNTTTTFTSLDRIFKEGIGITNTSSGTITVTVGYTQ